MKKNHLIPILFFGTLWGLSEVLLGNYFYAEHVPNAAIYLNAIAVFILAYSRRYLPFIGAAAMMGGIALLFKIFHSPFYACHMLAILLFGIGFDIAYSLIAGRDRSTVFHKSLGGLAGAFLGIVIFAVTITFVIRYEYWVQPGMSKFLNYIFVTGSAVAVCAAFLAPLAHVTAAKTGDFVNGRFTLKPAYINTALILITLSFWLLVDLKYFY